MSDKLTHDQRRAAKLKFGILAEGLRVTTAAYSALTDSKRPLRTRSGVSGGLDLNLGQGVYVNAPVVEAFAKRSSLELDVSEEKFVIHHRMGDIFKNIEPLPEPAYYKERTSKGADLMLVGQMCSGDRFCYGMTGPGCFFWGKDRRCAYCSIGTRDNPDLSKKRTADFLYALDRAVSDPILPARHVLIGGGTPSGDDMGAKLAAELTRMVKKQWNLSVYVMIAAPLRNEFLDMLIDAGADEIGINIEFWSDESWRKFIPGKERIIGKSRYLDALEYCAKRLHRTGARSIIIAGLEHPDFTIEAIEKISSLGVMPILSPFRPLAGTDLQHRTGFSADEYWDLYESAVRSANKYDIPLGPTCIHCQNNILALPFGKDFKYY